MTKENKLSLLTPVSENLNYREKDLEYLSEIRIIPGSGTKQGRFPDLKTTYPVDIIKIVKAVFEIFCTLKKQTSKVRCSFDTLLLIVV